MNATVAVASLVPAVALSAETAAQMMPGQTRIAKLHAKLQELKAEYQRWGAKADALKAEVESQMPAPHPSIVNTPENRADVITQWSDNGRAFHWTTIGAAQRAADKRLEEYAWDAANGFDTGIPEEIAELEARRDRLKARIPLAEAYQEELRRRLDGTDYPAINEQMEAIAAEEGRVLTCIERSRPKSRGDIEIKLAMLDADSGINDDELPVGCLVRDLRHLLKNPAILAA